MGVVIQLPECCRFHRTDVHTLRIGECVYALAVLHHLEGICKAQIAKSGSRMAGRDKQAQVLDRSLACLPAWDLVSMHAESVLVKQGKSKALGTPLRPQLQSRSKQQDQHACIEARGRTIQAALVHVSQLVCHFPHKRHGHLPTVILHYALQSLNTMLMHACLIRADFAPTPTLPAQCDGCRAVLAWPNSRAKVLFFQQRVLGSDHNTMLCGGR